MEPDAAPTALSERGLAAALASGGRDVSIAELVTWRRNGLLPPLVSHGVGIARGKSYCWHDPDILPRAALVWDALHHYRRNDMALLMLFLSGHAVPLAQLRRAWIFRCKLRKAPVIRALPVIVLPASPRDDGPLLDAALAMAAAIQTDHHRLMLPLLEQGLEKLGHARRGGTQALCRMMLAMEAALDASDLVRTARDEDIRQAQAYLTRALAFLKGCAALQEQAGLTEMMGPSLFGFILSFLRSGQGALVARVAAQMDAVEQPGRARRQA